MSGPVPKRSAERRRRNATPGAETVSIPGVVVAPAAEKGLHPIAMRWFEALKESGQAQFYEPSDWATAAYIAHAMSESLKGEALTGAMLSAVMSSMTGLLVTEGDRRRMRLEIEREAPKQQDPAGVTKLADFRRRAR